MENKYQTSILHKWNVTGVPAQVETEETKQNSVANALFQRLKDQFHQI